MRDILNNYSQDLLSLTISECINFLPEEIPPSKQIIKAPKLRKFVLHWVELDHSIEASIFTSFPKLTYLDLSDCRISGNFLGPKFCPNLTTLILYNVPYMQKITDSICQLTQLRYQTIQINQ